MGEAVVGSVAEQDLTRRFRGQIFLKFLFFMAGGLNLFRTLCLVSLKLSFWCCVGKNIHKNRLADPRFPDDFAGTLSMPSSVSASAWWMPRERFWGLNARCMRRGMLRHWPGDVQALISRFATA